MKKCCMFDNENAQEAYENIEVEFVEDYGDFCNGRYLYTWDDGGRHLLRCRKCGGYILVQKSEYHNMFDGPDSYYTDYIAVTGPEQARWLNENYSGFELEIVLGNLGIRFLTETNWVYNWSHTNEPFSMEEVEILLKADAFAREKHGTQRTKEGAPYIEHPRKVSTFVDDFTEKVVALLHDTVEDTDTTVEEIRKIFGDRVAECVNLLTKPDGVTYDDYIDYLINYGNVTAMHVKLADLTHNSDLSRLGDKVSDPENIGRAEKYKRAKAKIEAALAKKDV